MSGVRVTVLSTETSGTEGRIRPLQGRKVLCKAQPVAVVKWSGGMGDEGKKLRGGAKGEEARGDRQVS